MPRRFAILVSALALVTTVSADAAAQHELPLVSAEIDMEAFAVPSADEIRRGRVSIVYRPGGVELVPHFVRSTATGPIVEQPDPPPTPEPSRAASAATRETALWVWNTAEILRNPVERADFLDFVEVRGITRLFLYLPPAEGAVARAGYIPFDSEEIGALLGQLSERGARAYALDGDRYYVLEENHEGVFRTVRALVEHNRRSPPDERFLGVRYDIEPYLVPGFQGALRQSLLDGYVQLIAGASEIARAGGLRMAVDIPFWFDAADEDTGAFMQAELDGVTEPILEHVMAAVDDLAIMDYRTSALGPNGAVALAHREVELGERFGVDVFVGVETVDLPDEDLITFYGPATEGFPPHADARWVVIEGRADGARPRIWIVDSEEALAQLAVETEDAVHLRHWPAGRPTRIRGDMQSFHSLGADRMDAVTNEIVRHLTSSPSFVGLAYHEYRTLKELVERR